MLSRFLGEARSGVVSAAKDVGKPNLHGLLLIFTLYFSTLNLVVLTIPLTSASTARGKVSSRPMLDISLPLPLLFGAYLA